MAAQSERCWVKRSSLPACRGLAAWTFSRPSSTHALASKPPLLCTHLFHYLTMLGHRLCCATELAKMRPRSALICLVSVAHAGNPHFGSVDMEAMQRLQKVIAGEVINSYTVIRQLGWVYGCVAYVYCNHHNRRQVRTPKPP